MNAIGQLANLFMSLMVLGGRGGETQKSNSRPITRAPVGMFYNSGRRVSAREAGRETLHIASLAGRQCSVVSKQGGKVEEKFSKNDINKLPETINLAGHEQKQEFTKCQIKYTNANANTKAHQLFCLCIKFWFKLPLCYYAQRM